MTCSMLSAASASPLLVPDSGVRRPPNRETTRGEPEIAAGDTPPKSQCRGRTPGKGEQVVVQEESIDDGPLKRHLQGGQTTDSRIPGIGQGWLILKPGARVSEKDTLDGALDITGYCLAGIYT